MNAKEAREDQERSAEAGAGVQPQAAADTGAGVSRARSATLAWVLGGFEGYGVRRGILSLATELRRRGLGSRFYTLGDGEIVRELKRLDFPVDVLGVGVSLGFPGGWARKLVRLMLVIPAYIQIVTRIRRLVSRDRPLSLNARHVPMAILAGLVGRLTGRPRYWLMPSDVRSHGLMPGRPLAYQLGCWLLGLRPIANSEFTRRSLGDGLVKARVLYEALDATRFDPDRTEAAAVDWGVTEPAEVTLGILARICPQKAQDLVIEACERLRCEEGRRIRLLLVGGLDEGSGEFTGKIRAWERTAEWLKLAGPVSDVERYYPTVDVVVNSRRNAEPFGLTIVEAMLMRRPVLAYYEGGPSETIEDNITGWLIREASVSGFCEGIRACLKARSAWAEMGERARDRALKHFTVASYADGFLEVLRDDGVLPAGDRAKG